MIISKKRRRASSNTNRKRHVENTSDDESTAVKHAKVPITTKTTYRNKNNNNTNNNGSKNYESIERDKCDKSNKNNSVEATTSDEFVRSLMSLLRAPNRTAVYTDLMSWALNEMAREREKSDSIAECKKGKTSDTFHLLFLLYSSKVRGSIRRVRLR